MQPERPHRTSLHFHQPASLPARLQGPLYPTHLSGTSNPRTQPVEAETVYLDGSLTSSDVKLEPSGELPFSMWMTKSQQWPFCLLDGWEHSMANKLPFVLRWQPCGGDCKKKHAGLPRSLPTAASSTEGIADLRKSTEAPGRHQRWWARILPATQNRQGSHKVVKVLSHIDEAALVESGQSLTWTQEKRGQQMHRRTRELPVQGTASQQRLEMSNVHIRLREA